MTSNSRSGGLDFDSGPARVPPARRNETYRRRRHRLGRVLPIIRPATSLTNFAATVAVTPPGSCLGLYSTMSAPTTCRQPLAPGRSLRAPRDRRGPGVTRRVRTQDPVRPGRSRCTPLRPRSAARRSATPACRSPRRRTGRPAPLVRVHGADPDLDQPAGQALLHDPARRDRHGRTDRPRTRRRDRGARRCAGS